MNIAFIPVRGGSKSIPLKNIKIPYSITSVGDYAFAYCDSLTSIEIPDSVTSIGKNAFGGNSLTSITFKWVSPITYNTNALWFDNTTSLTHIYVPYGCAEAYKIKWAEDGAEQSILDLIVESDREAMMSNIKDLQEQIEANKNTIASDSQILAIFN
jgi:hypothetical protein